MRIMKPRTEELVYLLLWCCDALLRPTFRNLTGSFENWAYRNGLGRQLLELEKQRFLESRGATLDERVYRLTESGRLHALGGRDPVTCWEQDWDGVWRMVLFDVPTKQNAARNRLRQYLRERGFGWLQNSVWVTPHSITAEREVLAGSEVSVESLLFLDARPAAGERDAEIVAGAWEFKRINAAYERHLSVLARMPQVRLSDEPAAMAFREWAGQERLLWLEAVTLDPLLPERLLPKDYLGRKAWRKRVEILGSAAQIARSFVR
jgi:phenylacetic acid degradation operon negative regulatory protein